ncbi:MAG: methylenetetrahydrofolate reductase [NAD(P)H], partial [Gammaproteobacteria bacterium]
MKIVQLFNVSFEFFPPKSAEGVQQLVETASLLAEHHPHFFSVTFGAGGSNRAGTMESVKLLQQYTGIAVAPHLACIGSSRTEILEMLQAYRSIGVRRIVALRGDL